MSYHTIEAAQCAGTPPDSGGFAWRRVDSGALIQSLYLLAYGVAMRGIPLAPRGANAAVAERSFDALSLLAVSSACVFQLYFMVRVKIAMNEEAYVLLQSFLRERKRSRDGRDVKMRGVVCKGATATMREGIWRSPAMTLAAGDDRRARVNGERRVASEGTRPLARQR